MNKENIEKEYSCEEEYNYDEYILTQQYIWN